LFDELRRAPVFGHVRPCFDGPTADHNVGHCPGLSLFRRPLHTYAIPAEQKGRPASAMGADVTPIPKFPVALARKPRRVKRLTRDSCPLCDECRKGTGGPFARLS